MPTASEASSTSPLTTNVLDQRQRARLIRSTRKLEAVLGTTPHLADTAPIHVSFPDKRPPPPPTSKASRRHASIFNIFPITPPSHAPGSDTPVYASTSTSTNSSVSSFSLPEPQYSVEVLPTPKSFSSKPRRSAEAPKALVLCRSTFSVEPCDKRVPLSPFSTQDPTTPTLTSSPRTPTVAELRRKRLAKLTRTFGEHVPAEFVFPQAPRTASRSRQRAKQASHQQSPPPVKRSSQIWVTGGSAGAWVGEWNRKDIKDVQHKLRNLRST